MSMMIMMIMMIYALCLVYCCIAFEIRYDFLPNLLNT